MGTRLSSNRFIRKSIFQKCCSHVSGCKKKSKGPFNYRTNLLPSMMGPPNTPGFEWWCNFFFFFEWWCDWQTLLVRRVWRIEKCTLLIQIPMGKVGKPTQEIRERKRSKPLLDRQLVLSACLSINTFNGVLYCQNSTCFLLGLGFQQREEWPPGIPTPKRPWAQERKRLFTLQRELYLPPFLWVNTNLLKGCNLGGAKLGLTYSTSFLLNCIYSLPPPNFPCSSQ